VVPTQTIQNHLGIHHENKNNLLENILCYIRFHFVAKDIFLHTCMYTDKEINIAFALSEYGLPLWNKKKWDRISSWRNYWWFSFLAFFLSTFTHKRHLWLPSPSSFSYLDLAVKS